MEIKSSLHYICSKVIQANHLLGWGLIFNRLEQRKFIASRADMEEIRFFHVLVIFHFYEYDEN